MVSLTLSVSPELKKRMDDHPDINWSAVARIAIEKRIDMLEKFREFTADSELTEQEALSLGRKLNSRVAKKYLKMLK